MIGSTAVNYISASVITALCGVGFLAGVGLVDTLDLPPPRSLALVSLDYENREFVQRHSITGVAAIRAKWSAEIMRGERQLCSGGGIAPYATETKRFTPSAWTGAECPELEAGDVARASWEYTTPQGYVVSISGQISIE